MIVERNDGDHYSEIHLYPGERHPMMRYTVTCMDFDIVDDCPALPTARISLLTTTSATIEAARQLSAEYQEVAAWAAVLQTEKRAKYAELRRLAPPAPKE